MTVREASRSRGSVRAVVLVLVGAIMGLAVVVGGVFLATKIPAVGLWLKRVLGKDTPDYVVDTKAIVAACNALKARLDAGEKVTGVDCVVWNPKGTLGFGEHAGLELRF